MSEPVEPSAASSDVSSATVDKSQSDGGESLNILRVIKLLSVAVGVGAFVVLAGWLWTSDFTSPMKVTGRVTWNGVPVTTGAVLAQSLSDPTLGPIGGLDENGNFELLNNMQPGLPRGTYKLKVSSFSSGMPPKPLVPEQYTTYSTTPFTVEVTGDPASNYYDLKLTGELPESARPASERSDGDSGESSETGNPDETNRAVPEE